MDDNIFIYVKDLDSKTLNQFNLCTKLDFVKTAALMPDAHSGYVAPIGSVIVTQNVIIPAWVGYDIGCGIFAGKIKLKKLSSKELLKKIKENSDIIFQEILNKIPMGKSKLNHIQNISKKTKEEFKIILADLKKKEYNQELFKILKNKTLSNLGTLGSGNHFIEIGYDFTNNELWLIIHSGSRNIGHLIATKYMQVASNSKEDFEKTSILEYNSNQGKQYLNSVEYGLKIANLNRNEMANKVVEILKDILNIKDLYLDVWANKNHNHVLELDDIQLKQLKINLENKEDKYFIHRKGAISARRGEKGIIPANMRDGCYLVEGLGDKQFLLSSSHGAGRILSRKDAKNKINLNEFKKTMLGITANISENTKDESPQTYKDINQVMQLQKNSVKIISKITPIINWKGE